MNVRSLKRLNKYLWRYKTMLLLGFFFIVISNFFAVIPAQIVRHAFDLMRENIFMYRYASGTQFQTHIASTVTHTILIYAAIIVCMAILKGLFMFLMRQTIIVVSRKIEYDLKNDIYQHLQNLSLAYYRRHNTGDLMARISEDVSRVRMYLGPAIMYLINLTSLIILTITIMIAVSPKLTLFVLLPLPLLAISIYIVNNITYNRSMRIQRQLSVLTTYVQEVFSGIRVIKSFSAENSVKNHFEDEVKEYKNRAMAQIKVDAAFFPLILFLVGLSVLITLYVGGNEVIKGNLTPGVIAEFFIYVNLLTWPVAALGYTTSMIQRAAASQARINEVLDEKPEVVTVKEDNIITQGNITFDNVSFIYPDTGIQALKDVNFKIKSGEWLGIIGPTGSGKSTIGQLILRTYDPTSGTILIDGTDVKNINLGQYREQIGYVPQDDFLFSDTITNNIFFGVHSKKMQDQDSDAFKEKLKWAAKSADVYKDIESFPNGFQTLLGERGVTLSGGQKQRVSIARAIVKNPQIMVLDDCFSAIDTNTEAQILHNLSEVMRGKTSVIISHRVSTVKNCSQIIVLEGGIIKEKGTHDSLMAEKGYYAHLYHKQLVEKELYDQQKIEGQ